MHVKVVDQQTNEEVLIYNSGMKLNATVDIDNEREGEDKYYIELNSTEFKSFKPYKYYKVQLRSCAALSSNNDSIGQLYRSTAIYSEWSTVCLIKGIETPQLNIRYFTNDPNLDVTQTGVLFKTNSISVRGGMLFEDEVDTNLHLPEDIKTYSVQFFDNEGNLLDDSGDLYPPVTNLRAITYDPKCIFEDSSISYVMKITVLTTSYFTFSEKFRFCVSDSPNISPFDGIITKDNDNGVVNITLTKITQNNEESIVYIRRTDSNSNFKIWQDIYSIDVPSADISQAGWELNWKDCTIESGVWYQYAVQSISLSSHGIRSQNKILPVKDKEEIDKSVLGYEEYAITSKDKIMLIFDNSFLVGKDGQQLQISYDNVVDSLKYSQYISKTDTIGSKYPFIRQNSATCYRTFNLSGLITVLSDTDNLFITKDDLFVNKQILNLYHNYNEENGVTQYNDYITEREFREAVMNFLITDDVKLFRSTTEGNILIKLMDVSFSPKQELGRYLYSFSATAVECGECSIDNYAKYKIQRQSDTSYNLISKIIAPNYKITTLDLFINGQIMNELSIPAGDDLKQKLIEQYELDDYNHQTTGYIINSETGEKEEVENIDEAVIKTEYELVDIQPYKMSIEFLDNPYPIDRETKEKVSSSDISGWRFNVVKDNGETEKYIISSSTGIYIYSSEDPLTFQSLIFPYATDDVATNINVVIDAKLVYEKKTYYRQNENGEWIEIEDEEESTPPITTGGIVTYTIHQVASLNSEDVSNVWTGKNLTDVIRNKINNGYLVGSDKVLTSLDVYAFQCSGFSKGAIIQVTYNDDKDSKFIIQKTGSIDINLDDDTSDTLTSCKKIEFLGQLISNNENLSGNFLLSSDNIKLVNSVWNWVTDNSSYPITFYSDLSFTTAVNKEDAEYGIINGCLDVEVATVEMYIRTGVQEGTI